MYINMKFSNVVLLFLSSLLCVSNEVYGKTWVLLYTGIQDYTVGYASEAAVARFYNTMINRNIPKENIVTITPNYAAYCMFNPFPGVLVHGTADEYVPGKSKNYYDNVKIDYNALDMNQNLIYEILAGNKTAVKDLQGSGRVIESGPKDNVLVYINTISADDYWLFSNKYFLRIDTFIEGFDKLRDEKRFEQMKIIFDANNSGHLFDDFLDANRNIMGYSMGSRYSPLIKCFENPYLRAVTGSCSSLAFFESLDKVLKQSNSDKLSVFDILEDHRNYTAHVPNMDSPNLYGKQELAGKPLSTYYGLKGKKQAEGTEQTETMRSSTKTMMAEAIKNGQTLTDRILETLPSDAQRKFFRNLVSRIASKIIRRNSFTEEELNQPTFYKMSPEKIKEYDAVVQAVRSNCYEKQALLLMATQPFEKLARLVKLNVPFIQIEEAIKQVCPAKKE